MLPPWRVEVSLNLAVAVLAGAFLLLYGALRGISLTLGLPERVRAYRGAQKKAKAAAAGGSLDKVTDYRFPEATRKNNPPAKIAAEGHVPLVPKAEYT